MTYIQRYASPLGGIVMAAHDEALCGLWFEGQKYFAAGLESEVREEPTPVLDQAARWLDVYFSGEKPDFMPPLMLSGTAFQQDVWQLLTEIPFGQTTTYGAIAARLAQRRGLQRMSALAVGSAVAHNRISIIVPCHRVLGADGSLTGYAGGLDKKKALLEIEKPGKRKAPSNGERSEYAE